MKLIYQEIRVKRFLANSKGYGLPELLITLTILGILMAIAVPNYSNWVLRRQMDKESKNLYLNLMLARIQAIKNNNNVVVTFNNPAANQYTVHDDTDSDNVVDAGENVKTVALIPRVRFAFFGAINDINGNNVTNAVFLAGGGNVLTFNSTGQASTSGSIYMLPTSDVGVSNLLLRAVDVVQATGNVDVWEYIDGPTPIWR